MLWLTYLNHTHNLYVDIIGLLLGQSCIMLGLNLFSSDLEFFFSFFLFLYMNESHKEKWVNDVSK